MPANDLALDRNPTVTSPPSLQQFLVAPLQTVARVAPETLVMAPGGTRRSARFAGIEPESTEYFTWSRRRIMSTCELIFRHGVKHIFVGLFTQRQFRETTRGFRGRILESMAWGVGGDEAVADYARLGWRVHFWGTQQFPELHPVAERLHAMRPPQNDRNLWWFVGLENERIWPRLAEIYRQETPKTHQELIRALYGEDVPAATLFLAFGKPMVSPDLVPPLLMGDMQCYWSQRPSYDLDARQLRSILYDFAFVRATWRADKRGRARQALTYRHVWENAPTLGLGTRLGPHWYPQPVAPVDDLTDAED